MQMLIFVGKQRRCRHSFLSLFFLTAAFISVGSSFAASATGYEHSNRTAARADTIRGKVLDEKGTPLPGVVVQVKGTKKGTQTNEQGIFTLTVNSRAGQVLAFSYIGYQKQEMAAGTGAGLTIRMKPLTGNLDEVVVIGYGTVSRKDLTGAVSSVNADDLKDVPVNSAADALAGRLAGVEVTSSEGAPGAPTDIIIRGGGSITQDNSPLYVIDGIQVESGLDGISPQDIASIDILKDASATAIYGARGANGVVIVTTKGGRAMKTTVSYNGLMGLNKLANSLDVMNPYDFVVYQYERSRGNEADELSFANNYGSNWDTLATYHDKPDINWQREMFGRDALMQTHNVAITGGNAATKFNISLTKNIQQGIMLNSDFNRNIVNIKVDHTANNKLSVGFTLRGSDQAITGSGTSSGGFTQSSRLRQTIRYKPLLTNPALGIDDFDQAYYNETNALGNGVFLINPLALNKAEYRKTGVTAFNIGGYFNYKFTPYLSFRTTAGFDYSAVRSDAFDDINTPGAIGSGLGLPMVNVINTDKRVINVSNVLSFSNASLKKTGFNKNNAINFLVGQEIYQLGTKQVNNRLRQFPVGITADKALGQLNLGTVMPGYPTSQDVTSRISSFFTRINYAYRDKYLASFTVRADGSSKFADNNRWGYFPSGSVAWRLSQEDFMKRFNFISDLKLRASYGESGNNRIGDFLYLQSFLSTTYPYGLGEVLVPGYVVTQLANPNLKWERTVSKNLGLDLSLFRNRVQLTVDAYQNDVKDLLINVPIPGNSGYSVQLQNVGTTRNRGIEFQVAAGIINKKNFSWKSSFNLSFNRNTIQALSTYQPYYYQNSGWGISGQLADYIVKVGEPVGAMYGFITDGYYKLDDFDYDASTRIYSLKKGVPTNISVAGVPQPGSIKFKDLDGDGVVDANHDRTIIGNANPKFTGGLNQQFRYKQFDMSVFVNFVYGNNIMNANKIEFTNGYLRNNNMLSVMNNRWRTIDGQGNVIQSTVAVNGTQVATGEAPEVLAAVNKNAGIWMPIEGAGAYTLHSWAVEDGSFLRINNITLGYTFSASLLSKIRVKGLRIYGTLNNLAVLTNYSGYDPEVNVVRSTPVTPGVDYSAYPRNKAYLFGLNLTL